MFNHKAGDIVFIAIMPTCIGQYSKSKKNDCWITSKENPYCAKCKKDKLRRK
ncbi:hypothetical protein LCGC14_2114290 [marine sediment metagenome]|uniref:Uncharacterized protein n=1 Tax=marine sediment metagenome TaxID=412755 RepID=A0A0F9E656_9ZZZZ